MVLVGRHGPDGAAEPGAQPEQVAHLVQAFETVCDALGVADRKGAAAEAIAAVVIQMAQMGLREADEISAAALARLRPSGRDGGSPGLASS